ncbi:MAG: alpha/beta fold hydrolase [Sandaracinaceae bacterium]
MTTHDARSVLMRPHTAPSTAFPQRDVTVHGMRLRYVDIPAREEERDEPILLIHGHSSRLEEYEALVPLLSKHRRVLVPDLPGSGYSDKPLRKYSLRFFEDTLLGVLDTLDVSRVHLGGGSLGGNLALRLAHREPGRFHKVAAWAPAGSWEPMRRWIWFGRFMRNLRFLFWPSLWVQSRFWYRRDWDGREKALRDAWAYYREVYGDGFYRMYWDIGVDQVMQSLFSVAPEIRQPTWLAVGDQDKALGMFQGVRRLATLLPNATLRIYEGARHSLANEVAQSLGAEVDAFLLPASTRRDGS